MTFLALNNLFLKTQEKLKILFYLKLSYSQVNDIYASS